MQKYSRFEPGKALRAVRDLLRNPDDLPKVFTVLESLSGSTLERLYERMARSTQGAALLAERPAIAPLLEDREALRALPEGSLGRTYLAFVEAEGISPAGIRAASADGYSKDAAELPPHLDFVQSRMRDTHDLWHAVTGYKGDVLGELSLLAFTLAQTWNPGIALIVGAGMLKTLLGDWGRLAPASRWAARRVIREGYARGKRAAWLPELRWEAWLATPVGEVRARLAIDAPPKYSPIRSADLRALAQAA